MLHYVNDSCFYLSLFVSIPVYFSCVSVTVCQFLSINQASSLAIHASLSF